jgi:hypothetical protein
LIIRNNKFISVLGKKIFTFSFFFCVSDFHAACFKLLYSQCEPASDSCILCIVCVLWGTAARLQHARLCCRLHN